MERGAPLLALTYPDPGTYAVRLQVCNALACDVRIRFLDVLPGGEPAAEIFADGFETGDLSRWSEVVDRRAGLL